MSKRYLLASLCGLGLIGLAFAADPQNQNQQNQQNPNQQRVNQPAVNVQVGAPAGQHGTMNKEHSLASCIAISNQEEVALARIAEDKAKSKEVKEFAQMLEKDHQAFLQKLAKFAPEAARDGFLMERTQDQGNRQSSTTQPRPDVNVQVAGGAQQNQQRDGQKIQQTAGTQDQGRAPHLEFMSMQKEIAQECLAAAKAKMTKEDGEKFDRCFIGHQIVMHEVMKAKLTVFQRHTSGELNQLISKGLETTESHLKKAEDIMKDLEKSSSESRRSSS